LEIFSSGNVAADTQHDIAEYDYDFDARNSSGDGSSEDARRNSSVDFNTGANLRGENSCWIGRNVRNMNLDGNYTSCSCCAAEDWDN